MLITRWFVLLTLLLGLFGLTFSFLWAQTGMPSARAFAPWSHDIQFFPSFFPVWIALLFLFFSIVWTVLDVRLMPESEPFRSFLTADSLSYLLLFLFVWLPCLWTELETPSLWFRAAMLGIFLFKLLLIFRALYLFPETLKPGVLVALSVGIFLLSYPLLHLSFSLQLSDLLHQARIVEFGVIGVKSIALSVMMLEMYRLSLFMTNSPKSALLSWIFVSFSFPLPGFPAISSILAGWLLIFILRMTISRINTRELAVGLLDPASITIGIKFFLIAGIIGFAGFIYWSNVKPGFEIHRMRALESAAKTMLDAQFGLLSYAPVYWLALFGITYLFYFRVWNGVLLIIIGAFFSAAYHLTVYGILERIPQFSDIVPFLAFFGVCMAVAHHRFAKFVIFRIVARVLMIATVAITVMLLLFYPDFRTIATRYSEIHRVVMTSLHRDVSHLFPSISFHPFPVTLFVLSGVMLLVAFTCSQIRTRPVYQHVQRLHDRIEGRFQIQKLLLYPFLLGGFLLSGVAAITSGDSYTPLRLAEPVLLNVQNVKYTLNLEKASIAQQEWTGILLVSSLTNSTKIPHRTPLATVIVNEQQGHFETFTLRAGRDTAERVLEEERVRKATPHQRAAIYHSERLQTPEGHSFAAHEYYTRLNFKHPLKLKNLSIKLLSSKDTSFPSNSQLQVKKILLLH